MLPHATPCCLALAVMISGTIASQFKLDDDTMLTRAVRHAVQQELPGKFERVTERPFKMDPAVSTLGMAPTDPAATGPHADSYCHVYVNRDGKRPLLTGKGRYPEGSLIIKQKFSDPEGNRSELFTVMRKMPPVYNTDHGDWEYSVLDATASQVLARGKIESCIDCHNAYEETDDVTRIYLQPGH